MKFETQDKRVIDHCFFVHNCFGSFFRGILDWYADDFYQRFNYKVISTYDKAVEFFKKKKELGHEVNAPILPSITLDPGLDFSPDERAGRFLWQYSTLAPGMGFKLFKPIDLKEQSVTVTPVFTRYQGTFELIFWLSSVYELLDFRTMFLQYMGGYGRYVRPKFFWSYLIFPDKIVNYKNDESIPIDWGNSDSTILHVETINKRKRSIPFPIDAIWKLDSLNDNSTKYGQDQISEYKLSATCTYEVNIPTYVVLDPHILENFLVQFSLGKTISRYPLCKPADILNRAGYYSDDINLLNKRSRRFYCIPRSTLDTAIEITTFPSETLAYPEKNEFIAWKSIYSGKLKLITPETKNTDVEKGDIILFDSYQPSYLSFARRASCILSHKQRIESAIYDKCLIMKKGIISDFGDYDFTLLKNYAGKDITVDIPNRKVYLDILPVIEDTSPQAGYELSQRVKDLDPELYKKAVNELELEYNLPENTFFEWLDSLSQRAITDNADGVSTLFPIKYPLRNEDVSKILVYVDDNRVIYGTDYTISSDQTILQFFVAPDKGSKIKLGIEIAPIREVVLQSIYEFTEDDETKKSDEYIIIDLPEGIKHLYELMPMSYIGRLQYEKDYEINFDTNKLTIKMKPKFGEIIEFFVCTIY